MRKTRLMVYDDYSTSQITAAISEWIHNKRDREILIDKLIDGMTFESLAEKHDISVRQTKNIVYKLQDRLSRHL